MTDLDPLGRGGGSLLAGLARLVSALRGGRVLEVEAKHVPAVSELRCSECNTQIRCGNDEHLFVQAFVVNVLRHKRIHAVGLCETNLVKCWWNRLRRRNPWHEVDSDPVGGIGPPIGDAEQLQRFGSRRPLPATVTPENPYSCRIPLPTDLPGGLERGGHVRAWVGKPGKGGTVSEPVHIPELEGAEPEPPQLCTRCQDPEARARRERIRQRHRHHRATAHRPEPDPERQSN